MSHLQMIHVPHINFHIWMSHGTHVNASYRQKKESLPCRSRVTHTRPSHVTRMNDPHQSHVTHMNEPCQTYEWTISESCHTCESVMFHVWIPTYGWVMSHVCITYITIMSHMWMSRVPRMNSHKLMSHATHKNQSCHAYEWTTSELCHTYKWVMSRVWIPKYEWAMSCTWTSHFENILASAMYIYIYIADEMILRRVISMQTSRYIWKNHVAHINALCHTYKSFRPLPRT